MTFRRRLRETFSRDPILLELMYGLALMLWGVIAAYTNLPLREQSYFMGFMRVAPYPLLWAMIFIVTAIVVLGALALRIRIVRRYTALFVVGLNGFIVTSGLTTGTSFIDPSMGYYASTMASAMWVFASRAFRNP